MAEKELVFAPCQRDIRYPEIRTWHIGEYYNEGGRRGVVFEVHNAARNGMILSLDEACLPFAVDRDFNGVNPAKSQIGFLGTTEYDGSMNQYRVSQIDGWREMYPAFAWCADLGKHWFLPSVEEAAKFLLDRKVRDAVNETLKKVYAKPIKGRSRKLCRYWTSTESTKGSKGDLRPRASLINLTCGNIDHQSKSQEWYVRAVGYF